MRRSIAFAVAAGIACLFISTAAQATDAIWGTASGNWSTVSATNGWTNAVPDAVGDTGTYDTTGHSSVTTTQDITGNRTVGKLEVKGSSTGSWTITLASGKNLVMDQDGAGPGVATLSNTQTVTGATSGGLIIGPNLGQIILNDDLLISNTGTSTRTSGSIQIDSAITGGHNVTYYNVSNDIGHGQIALQRNGATGSSYNNTTIAKGAVTFNRGDRFSPNANLFITLGSEANGDATLAYISAGGLGNMENTFIVAANTGGTTVFGTSAAVTGLTNIKSSGAGGQRLSDFNLLGDISYTSGGTGTLQIGGAIIGVGKVTKIGPGPMRVLSTNSYSGGTVVNEGSLAVGHADQITNCCGTYPATDGTLGSGNVTVNSTATFL